MSTKHTTKPADLNTFKENAFNSQYQELNKKQEIAVKIGKSRNRSIDLTKQVDLLTKSDETYGEN